MGELCRKNGILSPEYRATEVKVLNKIFKIPPDAIPEGRIDRQVQQTKTVAVSHEVRD